MFLLLFRAPRRIDSPEMNVEYRMSVQEYEELTPYAGDLVENWGKAPGHLNSDGQNLLVFGCKFGNVFIGVQPTFGYEVRASTFFEDSRDRRRAVPRPLALAFVSHPSRPPNESQVR